jgi:two-component system, cell cycle sensor histidine kinase and response regulator CckA
MGPNFIPKIMIVESYGSNFKSLSSHLSSFGVPLQITTSTDAPSAMARLQREPADLVIIDTLLRGNIDGFELCCKLRAAHFGQNVPIILLLGGTLSLERSKGILAGADLLLHRPVVKEELLKMLHLLLGRKLEQADNGRASAEPIPLRRLRTVV